MKWFLIYLAVISLISVIVCIYDKWAAKHRPEKRTRESTLLWLSAFGGSIAMLVTMLLIRHKTQHKKFMIGIPLIIIAQIAIIGAYWYFFLKK
jgi:uncharacterized membrane protein YsdA (DUF1294 family)